MPRDPERVAEVCSWFARAESDLRAAEVSSAADPPLLDIVVFHAQQAAEKSLKGFLCWHDRPFRKTHNLVEIGEACAAVAPDLEPVLRRAAHLSEYAWRYRYPGEQDTPTPAEAEEALALAHEVFRMMLEQLPADVKP